MIKYVTVIFLIVLGLTSCGDKNAPIADKNAPNLTSTPDVGGVEQVEVSAKGVGITPGAAVNDALKLAIQQVNGVVVDASSANLNLMAKATATLDVESKEGKDSAKATATMQGQAFAEQIISASNGVVSNFKVVSSSPPVKDGGMYAVEISAKIAKFKAPADAGKIKIVVTPLKASRPTFNIGGKEVPAAVVLDPVRQLIIDSLSQSGRYTVLDRQSDSEIQGELGMITSGQTNTADLAKLGQALSADILWVGVVNNLAYERSARKLASADRELVSFGGSWAISQRLVNLTTRQIMLSNTLTGEFPRIAPTTMGAGINEVNTLKDIQANIARKATNAIMMKTFPISILEIDGSTVALSQGEGSVKDGQQFKIFSMGKEMKDPQTGQSLGNMESECCVVTINRVTPKMSYGTLSDVKIKLDGVKPGVLQVREEVIQVAASPSVPAQATTPAASSPSVPAAPNPKSGGKKDNDW
jgi:curli biogenesis system outer membrane secretion channel CsgG